MIFEYSDGKLCFRRLDFRATSCAIDERGKPAGGEGWMVENNNQIDDEQVEELKKYRIDLAKEKIEE